MTTVLLAYEVAAMGWTVIDESSPAEIVVSIDPTIGPPTSRDVVCTPGAPLQVCEDGTLVRRGVQASDRSLIVRFISREPFGEELLLEIVPEGASVRARLFVREFTDAARGRITMCLPCRGMVSMSGTVRLNTIDMLMPELVHGVLEVNLAGGHTISVEF